MVNIPKITTSSCPTTNASIVEKSTEKIVDGRTKISQKTINKAIGVGPSASQKPTAPTVDPIFEPLGI